MLKLFNKEHEAISALTNLKDYKIEYVLSGEDLLEFSLSIVDENIHLVEEEGYVRTKNNEYVIKAMDPSQNFKRFSCVVNIEDIKGKSIVNFDTSNNNIADTIRLAIAGTGWILADNNISKRRTVRLKNTNALEVLREVRKVFRVDYRFDAINKIIYVYDQFGEDKGVYFSDELNLKSFAIPSDTYDYATRIYPYGKDGLTISSINNGKEYIENFQYSNKVIEYIWEDGRYTDINSLKEDAEAKLNELSKPKRSYQATITDLAKQSEEYKFLDFFLGDTITLLSKSEKFRDKQRIVKYIEYPNEPYKNTCELGNTTLTFEELQKENEYKNQVVDNITSDNGTLDGSKVDNITTSQISDFKASVAEITDLTVVNAEITNLKAQNVTITGKLTAIEGEFGTIKANVGVIDKLTVTHTAQINALEAKKASITQLEAVSATIGTLEATVGKIETLVNGNLSSENIQAGGITSDKLTISNGFITNAMIDSLDVSKINAGTITTEKFKIKSNDGAMEFIGSTQQFKDKNNKVRIQLGKDSQGNFNFIIRGEDGTTTLIDHTGVKAKAIADNLIVENMIASDAVGEKQINYSSFVTGFNKDTNTNTIKSSKVNIDLLNQTLDIAFNQLKTQSDGTKSLTESHSTTIGVMQGEIKTAINNTQIIKDGQTISLKDDYNRTVSTVNSMNSTIGSHTSKINEHTGKITGVETRVNTVERDLNSITQRVSSTETKVTTITATANSALTNANKGINDAKVASDKAIAAQNSANTAQTNATNAINLAKVMNEGKMIYTDPNFRKGGNSVGRYANSNPDNVTITRITKPSDCPSTSTHCLEIKHTGTSSPGYGGFLQNIQSRANAVFIQKFIAKLPVGYSLYTASNPMGTGYTDKWLTSNKGTGKWEEYIREVRCGSTGTFSGGGHVYVNGNPTPTSSAPLIWYLAYCTVFDITDNDERVNNLTTEITTTKSKVSSIETNLSSITSRVSTVETKQTTTDGKVTALETWKKQAEVKITDASIISTVSSQFYKKGETDSKYASQSQITQLDNKIALKVDANGVKSLIQQNPESVKIGFNGIDSRITMTNDGLFLMSDSGKRRLGLRRASLYAYNYNTNEFLGGWSPRISQDNTVKGLGVLASKNADFYGIAYSPNWTNEEDDNPVGATSLMSINFKDRGTSIDLLKGIQFYDHVFIGGNLNMRNFNIRSVTGLTCYGIYGTAWHTNEANPRLVFSIEDGTLKLNNSLNGNGKRAYGFDRITSTSNYVKNWYANHAQEKLMMHNDGWTMFADVGWDYQNNTLYRAKLTGSTYGIDVVNNNVETTKKASNLSLIDEIEVIENLARTGNQLIIDVSDVTNKEQILLDDDNLAIEKLLPFLLKEIKDLKEDVRLLRA